ncbi:hypothetical protein ACPYPG_03290 [Streptomyces sp. FR-108]|uniref:hypothetical protein n=1 Tax=Streptomyces sp. FR-108 TaxID=3416665 RepID=UPI003CFADB14
MPQAWNGKQRSGGGMKAVNAGTHVEPLAEDNPGPAERVSVSCDLVVPDEPGAQRKQRRRPRTSFTSVGQTYSSDGTW